VELRGPAKPREAGAAWPPDDQIFRFATASNLRLSWIGFRIIVATLNFAENISWQANLQLRPALSIFRTRLYFDYPLT
jgi:hypothetical protein